MELSKLVYEGEAIRIVGNRHVEITQITTNASHGAEGTLLIVIKDDVLLNLSDLQSKFSAIICGTELFEMLCEDIPCTLVCVSSPRRAWALAESRIRQIDYSNMKFVAVTGTNGKTTTATIIKHILKTGGNSIGFIGTGLISIGDEIISEEYYSMTTPDPPLLYDAIKRMSERNVEYVVMEVSSHAIYYEKTSAIRFALSVFTNLSSEHLDFHRTMSEYAETKLRLAKQSDTVLLNIDDPAFRRAYDSINADKCSFGILWDADFRATDLRDLEFDGAKFIFRGHNFSFAAKSHLIGKFNIYNALSALSAATSLGIKPCVAKEALANFSGTEGRIETVYNKDIRVIIDYAHTPNAFENVLKTVNTLKKTWQNIITVFGCGGERDHDKRSVMGSIAEKYSSKIYITEDNSRNEPTEAIISEILFGVQDARKREIITSRSEAIKRAIVCAENDDIVLILGKGHERYTVNSRGIHEYDERDIIKSAFGLRKNKYAK